MTTSKVQLLKPRPHKPHRRRYDTCGFIFVKDRVLTNHMQVLNLALTHRIKTCKSESPACVQCKVELLRLISSLPIALELDPDLDLHSPFLNPGL